MGGWERGWAIGSVGKKGSLYSSTLLHDPACFMLTGHAPPLAPSGALWKWLSELGIQKEGEPHPVFGNAPDELKRMVDGR